MNQLIIRENLTFINRVRALAEKLDLTVTVGHFMVGTAQGYGSNCVHLEVEGDRAEVFVRRVLKLPDVTSICLGH
jgi:hypothetical protein